MVRPKPPHMSAFSAYSRIGVDRHRQAVETLCMMVSIIGQGITNILEDDTDTDSQEEEHRGLPTMISMTQEQLVGIGSDKLPSLPWDPEVHFVSRSFHFMMTQVALKSHLLHHGLVWSGPAGTYPME